MSNNELLITPAGGDGIDAIESRVAADIAEYEGLHADRSIRDRETLLKTIKDQQAKLDRVIELAHWAGKRGWTVDAAAIRGAIEDAEDVALFDAGIAEEGPNVALEAS